MSYSVKKVWSQSRNGWEKCTLEKIQGFAWDDMQSIGFLIGVNIA